MREEANSAGMAGYAATRPGWAERRSGRISRQVPILLIGSDAEGTVFCEETHTVVLSLHGAGVVSRHRLVAEQELVLRIFGTNREAEIHVVGEIAEERNLYTYGVAFLDEKLDFWGVEFPPAPQWEERPEALTLQCSGCQGVEEIRNGDFEYDICVIHGGLPRFCNECGYLTVWRRSSERLENRKQERFATETQRTQRKRGQDGRKANGEGLFTGSAQNTQSTQRDREEGSPRPTLKNRGWGVQYQNSDQKRRETSAEMLSPQGERKEQNPGGGSAYSGEWSADALSELVTSTEKPSDWRLSSGHRMTGSTQTDGGGKSAFGGANLQEDAVILPVAEAPVAERGERRDRTRAKVNFLACVRTEKFGDDVVKCIDMSKGGVSFKSEHSYTKELRVEIAVPFAAEVREAPAIFVRGRIANVVEMEAAGMWRCGVEFLR